MDLNYETVLPFVVSVLLVVLTSILLPAFKKVLDAKLEEQHATLIYDAVYNLVRAAEQLFDDNDEKKDYVMLMISDYVTKRGIAINRETLESIVESVVWIKNSLSDGFDKV